ncbi:hypothetical protein [Stenomitos frigidus]|uniref:Uncharacterized protein n=1 Tax=Stenomitos frigidus ULC18 TaxID=2107698 RepID=A0A2T1E559_9CYAN|nr:hypothetical protein [Stenomitos frigidus]PSB27866.1 hypothetical protein C7B82_15935 [Stenomitos frigidus ULC18]
MTHSEIEAALTAAFKQCEAALHPLSDRQKQILLQAVRAAMQFEQNGKLGHDRSFKAAVGNAELGLSNPLEQLTPEERQTFLAFVELQERQNQPWKITLLNDWLSGRSSGAVQFIRERYGIQWVEQITPLHLADYIDLENDDGPRLKVGDRIEVTNGLWEWVQETGPCSREWFPCTVVSVNPALEASGIDPASTENASEGVDKAKGSGSSEISCIIRFEDGTEYEIQGVYDWNRPNWRWLDP